MVLHSAHYKRQENEEVDMNIDLAQTQQPQRDQQQQEEQQRPRQPNLNDATQNAETAQPSGGLPQVRNTRCFLNRTPKGLAEKQGCK